MFGALEEPPFAYYDEEASDDETLFAFVEAEVAIVEDADCFDWEVPIAVVDSLIVAEFVAFARLSDELAFEGLHITTFWLATAYALGALFVFVFIALFVLLPFAVELGSPWPLAPVAVLAPASNALLSGARSYDYFRAY